MSGLENVIVGCGAAWSAAWLDAEGSISLARSRAGDARWLRLSVTSTDLDVLERFAGVVGCGAISEAKARHDRYPHHRQQYVWATGRRQDVLRLVTAWQPYLSRRRQKRIAELVGISESYLQVIEANLRPRACASCGGSFVPDRRAHSTQAYCTARCRQRASYLRQRERTATA